MSLLPSSPLPRPRPRRPSPSPSQQPQQNNRRQLILLLLYRCSFMIGITYFTVHNYLNLIPASSTFIYNTNYIIPNNGDNNGGSTSFVGTRNNNNTIVASSASTNTNTAQTKIKNTATANTITTNYDASYSSALSDVGIAKVVNIADDFDLPSAASSESSSSSQLHNTNSNNRLDCGKKKCFISSLAYPNDLGYLVGNYQDYDKQLLKFIKAWEFTKWIDTQQFNSDDNSSNSNSHSNSNSKRRYHFYSKERPTIVELSNTTLTQLNRVVYHTNQKKYSPEFYTKSKVAIQKVRKVNIKNMLFFGCFSHNYDRYLEEKNTFFLKNNNHNNNNVNVDVNNLNNTNTNNFLNNLIESIQIMKRLLKLQPKMFTDFQVLFDSNGYVYFLDMEAQYELTARWKIGLKEKQQDCLQKIDDILK